MVEAQKPFSTTYTDMMSGLDVANNIMGAANKLASHKVDIPAATRNIGNIDLRNSLRDFGVPPEKMEAYLAEEKETNEQISFMLDITPGVGAIKEGTQMIMGKNPLTKEQYGPDDYAWGTLAVVSGGTSKVVGRVFGKVGDLEKKANNLEKAAKNIKYEVKILGRGSTGRTTAKSLEEQLAMKEVKSNPLGKPIPKIVMTDPRWPHEEGWVKMAQNVNGVEIHYVKNTKTGEFDDFKFTN
ncbi:pre-toxin TG domain-containing protein [Bacillus cytotoxicus]|nr:pre-toxin TG domain-containing protein [Bacillus cytotoxicus]MDH2892678.1 pre-toxin TG domain-containing protein [Bacillus cytotoxicus]